MRIHLLICLLPALVLLPLAGRAQTSNAGPPPVPSGFDPQAKAPPNLPARLDIPIDTRIDVTASRKTPLSTPLQPNDPMLLWDPALKSAVIERGPDDIHAIFTWEGGRASEAYVIRGICFRTFSLAYPNMVGTGSFLNFWVNRSNHKEGKSGDFPGISWYSPSAFVGKASVNGSDVFVFAGSGNPPEVNTYPKGESICLDSKTLLPVYLDSGSGEKLIFTFTYSPDPHVQIDPQGPYLKAIQNYFGHYP